MRSITVTVQGQRVGATTDGTQIYVPWQGRTVTIPCTSGTHTVPGRGQRTGLADVAGKLGLKVSEQPKAAAKPARKTAVSPADRPVSVTEMVGQDRARTQLTVHVRAAKKRGQLPGHVLLTGPAGLGKSSLAEIAAHELGGRLIRASAPTMTTLRHVAQVLGQLNSDGNNVLFIDEVHALQSKLSDSLLTALEDRRIELPVGTGRDQTMRSVALPPFMLVAATTVEGELDKPFRDRLQMQLQLSYYSEAELAQIIHKAAATKGIQLVPPAAEDLARRSQGTPRIAKNLLSSCADYAQAMHDSTEITASVVAEALALAGVDELGLDERSRSYLACLCGPYRGGPTGVIALAATAGIDQRTISGAIEPFLLRSGLMRLTSAGRVATAAGFRHLGLSVPPAIRAMEGEEDEAEELPVVEVGELDETREFGLSDWLTETDDEDPTEPVVEQSLPARKIPTWTEDADAPLFPVDPAPVGPTAPSWDVPISTLIDSISDEVGDPVRFAEPDVPVTQSAPVDIEAEKVAQRPVGEPVQTGPARALVTTSVNFGLVSVAVTAHSLHAGHGVQLHLSHSGCGGRVSMPKTCKVCNQTLTTKDLGRCTDDGHQLTADQVADLSDIGKSIEVEHFADAAEIAPELFAGEHHQLRAAKGAERAYSVLCEALRAGDTVGIGRVTIRGCEQLVVIRPSAGMLVMSRLRWWDEIREVAPVERVDFSDAELDAAMDVVNAMSAKLDHQALADTSQAKLAALLAA